MSCANITEATYILKCHVFNNWRLHLFLRGIKPDRNFYGEITEYNKDGGRQIDINSTFSNDDYNLFIYNAKKIEFYSQFAFANQKKQKWDGMFAKGPINSPKIIFIYFSNDRQFPDAADSFVKITQILVPYIKPFLDFFK